MVNILCTLLVYIWILFLYNSFRIRYHCVFSLLNRIESNLRGTVYINLLTKLISTYVNLKF